MTTSPPQWVLHTIYGNKPVDVGAGPAYGGAVYSLIWGGQQLINQDPANGGQMQTAYYLENIPPYGNALNPTEAGNWLDHTSPQGNPSGSSTILTGWFLNNVHLQTLCHPAYWAGAYNGSLVSPDVLGKTVTHNYNGMGNVIHLQYDLTFNGNHNHCAIETCWYMPFNFTACHDSNTGAYIYVPPKTSQSSDHAVIQGTPDSNFACVIYSKAPNKVYGYGFDQQYPKVNIYFPEVGPVTIGQKIAWESFAVFGTLAEVQATLKSL